jgi:hypothetical protein
MRRGLPFGCGVALSMWGATAGVATPLLRGAAWRAVVRRDWRYAVVLVG